MSLAKNLRILASVAALAIVAGTASALPTVYVDPVSGLDANTGDTGAPVQTIVNALTKVDSGGTIELAAGTYNERFWCNVDVTIQGPNVTPPTAIVKAAAPIAPATFATTDIHPGEVDDGLIDFGATGTTRNITVKNITFDGSNYLTQPTLPSGTTRFPHVQFRAGTNFNADNCTFTNHIYSPQSIGAQSNMHLRGLFNNGNTANITNCTFKRYNKNAIAVITTTGATATFNVSGCDFTSVDPVAAYTTQKQQSTNALQFWAIAGTTLNGTVSGNTFHDSPPGGAGLSQFNYFKSASDQTIGYAILHIVDTGGTNNVVITGNTFDNCIGAIYFYVAPDMPTVIANNTFSNGLYLWTPYGDVYGGYRNEPTVINYILGFSTTGDVLNIGPGTYDLPRGMVNPSAGPVTIQSTAPATVRFTGALPANVVAGANVTLVPNFAFPDTDGDGISDALELMYYSNPNNRDTDGDGYDDGIEIRTILAGNGSGTGQNARIAASLYSNVYLDSDNDGVPNLIDPGTGADFDGDGFSDLYEIAQGGDANNGSTFPTVGDVNGTGATDNNDASVIFNYYLGNVSAPAFLSRGDIDRNGTIDYVDAVILFNWSLVPKRVPFLPYPK